MCHASVAMRSRKWGGFVDDIDFGDLIRASREVDPDKKMPKEITSENVGFNEPMLRAAIWRALFPKVINTDQSNADNFSMLNEVFLTLKSLIHIEFLVGRRHWPLHRDLSKYLAGNTLLKSTGPTCEHWQIP